jgi:hypothetical protein
MDLSTARGGNDERCSQCGAPMVPDQRYCVECGERRGERRFSITDEGQTTRASGGMPPDGGGRRPRRSWSSGGPTLIAGVGTLLLAIGVGVLIGRSGRSTPAASTAPEVITVGGPAGSGTSTSASSTSTTGTSTNSGEAAGANKSASKTSKSKTSTTSKASTTTPPAVKVGTPGKGAGYKNGKFTGEFFGEEEEK